MSSGDTAQRPSKPCIRCQWHAATPEAAALLGPLGSIRIQKAHPSLPRPSPHPLALSLCEPMLNPSFARQAIGRSHRMGQDKPLTVTRLLMKGAPMGRGSSGLCCTCCISVLLLETCKHALPPVSV